MRIGILSDTHDQLARTEAAVQLLRSEGAEVLIHCGDLTGPEILAACTALPCFFVFGNCDAHNVPMLERAAAESGATCLRWGGVIEVGGKRVGVTHGHMTVDVRRVLAAQPDYLLSGHSHIAADRREGPTRRINPGALHEADELTVALLDLDDDKLRLLTLPA